MWRKLFEIPTIRSPWDGWYRRIDRSVSVFAGRPWLARLCLIALVALIVALVAVPDVFWRRAAFVGIVALLALAQADLLRGHRAWRRQPQRRAVRLSRQAQCLAQLDIYARHAE